MPQRVCETVTVAVRLEGQERDKGQMRADERLQYLCCCESGRERGEICITHTHAHTHTHTHTHTELLYSVPLCIAVATSHWALSIPFDSTIGFTHSPLVYSYSRFPLPPSLSFSLFSFLSNMDMSLLFCVNTAEIHIHLYISVGVWYNSAVCAFKRRCLGQTEVNRWIHMQLSRSPSLNM